jgi:effector-binding domain-containing protein
VTTVSIQNVRARRLAAIRAAYARPELSSVLIASLDKVYAFLNERQIGGRGCNVVVYDGPGSMLAGVEIAGAFEPAGEVIAYATPAGRVATAQHVGPYREMGRTNEAIVAYCREAGLRLAGVSWEVYGDWEEDETKLLTDVFYLLDGA